MDADVSSGTLLRRVNSKDTVTTTDYDSDRDRIGTTQLAPEPKVLTLWVHDEAFSKEEVIINPATQLHVPKAGQVFEVAALKATSDVRDFETARGLRDQDGNNDTQQHQVSSEPVTDEEPPRLETDPSTRFLCLPQIATPELLAKHPSLQISIAKSTAQRFNLHNRTPVLVTVSDFAQHAATHIELGFRDAYLSRSDMWRLVTTELADKIVYVGQKIQFLGSLRATVKNITIGHRRVLTAVFSGTTIPVFRSEAARYVLFIQMSREMWDFDSEGDGEILFNRVINGFLPELFERWSKLEVKHLVSIVMFGRLNYEDVRMRNVFEPSAHGIGSALSKGMPISAHEDFYRVVVTDMSSAQWMTIMDELKKDFRIFLRDVSLHSRPESSQAGHNDTVGQKITGRPVTALKGNILEAINIAASQFASDYIDRDLVRTGISVVVITAGSGVFEVDRDQLNLTSENLTNNGIGIDIVCLSKMPLHSTPVFKYKAAPLMEEPKDRAARGSISASPHNKLHLSAKSLDQSVPLGVLSTSITSNTSPTHSIFTSSAFSEQAQNWCYGIPQWIDLSYWAPVSAKTSRKSGLYFGLDKTLNKTTNKRFIPRVRMYELQMMGLMELGLADISIRYLKKRKSRPRGDESSFSLATSENDVELTGRQVRQSLSNGKHLDGTYSDIKTARGNRTDVARRSRKSQGGMLRYDDNLFLEHNLRTGDSSQIKPNLSISKAPERSRPKVLPGADVLNKSTAGISQDSNKASNAIAAPSGDVILKTTRPKPDRVISKTSRTISLAFAGFGSATRALARTQVSVENVPAQSNVAKQPRPEGTLNSSSVSLLSVPRSDTLGTASDERSVRQELSDVNSPQVNAIQIPKPVGTSVENDSLKVAKRRSLLSRNKPMGAIEAFQDPESSSDSADTSDSSVSETTRKAALPFIRNVNASNPIKKDPNAAAMYGRWQHLYPRKPRAATVKWKSLCTPASVPLTTEDFPTLEHLESNFDSFTYNVEQPSGRDVAEDPKSRSSLLQDMISIRLAHGYQLVVQSALIQSAYGRVCTSPTFFKPSKLADSCDTIYLAMANTIQKLDYKNESALTVTKYTRRSNPDTSFSDSIEYSPYIRTILSQQYVRRPMKLTGFSEEYPWEMVDQHLAGSEQELANTVETLRFWRARFVLIPIDPPATATKLIPTMQDESDEEIHLRGITALTHIWQRYRYIAPENRKFRPTISRRRDPNPLEIKFETLNPSEVVAMEFDKLQLPEESGDSTYTELLPDAEIFERETSDLPKVARAMQAEDGIEIKNRRWHFRLHYNCFRGEEFINWILAKFKDIETRDEAVQFGNELMEHGLFHHVNGRHAFKDGHFFYSLDHKYHFPRSDAAKSAAPSSRRSERSVLPGIRDANVPMDSPMSMRARSGSNQEIENIDSIAALPARSSSDKKRVSISLSKMIRLDVDTRKRSNRREVINLHYDRLHNPENCYHLELSWLNVTSKLVEDAIVSWASSSEKYGLKLVEIPIAEVSNITAYEPFRAPYRVSLAVAPPEETLPSNGIMTADAFGPQPAPTSTVTHHPYQKALLKKFNFVLDLEATSDFPSDVEILYSWGKLEYKYTQFVHRSGVILAQITEDGDFLLLANRLYNTRYASTKDATGKFDKTTRDHQASGYAPTPLQKPQPHGLSQLQQEQHPPASGILAPNVHLHHHAHHAQQSRSPASPAVAPTPLLRAVLSESTDPTSSVKPGYAAGSDVPPQQILGAPLNALPPAPPHHHHHHSTFVSPEQIKDDLEAFCSSAAKLEAFYAEVLSHSASSNSSSSNASNGATPSSVFQLPQPHHAQSSQTQTPSTPRKPSIPTLPSALVHPPGSSSAALRPVSTKFNASGLGTTHSHSTFSTARSTPSQPATEFVAKKTRSNAATPSSALSAMVPHLTLTDDQGIPAMELPPPLGMGVGGPRAAGRGRSGRGRRHRR